MTLTVVEAGARLAQLCTDAAHQRLGTTAGTSPRPARAPASEVTPLARRLLDRYQRSVALILLTARVGGADTLRAVSAYYAAGAAELIACGYEDEGEFIAHHGKAALRQARMIEAGRPMIRPSWLKVAR